jgi:hypothetical protein
MQPVLNYHVIYQDIHDFQVTSIIMPLPCGIPNATAAQIYAIFALLQMNIWISDVHGLCTHKMPQDNF